MKSRRTTKRIATLVVAITSILSVALAQSPGKVMGKVLENNGQPSTDSEVRAFMFGVLKNGSHTDSLGRYSIGNLAPGEYELMVFVGGDNEPSITITKYSIAPGETRIQEIIIPVVTGTTTVIRPKIFTIDPGNPWEIPRDIILDSKIRGVVDLAKLAPGVYSADDGEPIQVRGARPGGTAFYMDGMKLVGEPYLPAEFMQSVTVLGGGVPAEYGDFTGGVVIVTTRNPGMKGSAGPGAKKVKKEKIKNQSENKPFDSLDLG